MTELPVHTDLTQWTPTPTQLPDEWVALTNRLTQEAWGKSHHYIMSLCRYDAEGVGDLLRNWGLPWQVVMAGYLWEYDERLIRSYHLEDTESVLMHIKASITYIDDIEDEKLLPLLTPPYNDLGALLLAVATGYTVFSTLLKSTGRIVGNDVKQVRHIGRTLLNITKRLGMWRLKREIEDLTEQLCDPTGFAHYMREREHILEQDTSKLEDIRQLLATHYQKLIGKSVSAGFIACGVTGLKRRFEDARTTTSSQKTQFTGFDLVTFYIAVPTVKACYAVLGAVSQLGFMKDPITDQIAHPKPNGYSHIILNLTLDKHSTHISLTSYPWMNNEQEYTCFIQIETPFMQAVMWYGCLHPTIYQLYLQSSQKQLNLPSTANYWKSSEGLVVATIVESVRATPQADTRNPIIVYDKSRNSVALPSGATALDFAYALSVSIGERAVEAFINDRKAPFSRPLEAGDIVEIISATEVQDQEDWIEKGYAVTSHAQSHIQKRRNQRQLEHRGYLLIKEALDQYHYKLAPEDLDDELRHLIKNLHRGTTRQSYLEHLSPDNQGQMNPTWAALKIIEQVKEREAVPAAEEYIWIPTILSSDTPVFIPQSLCGVCQPDYPRDEKIVGYRRRHEDLVVHSIHCPRLPFHSASPHSTMLLMTWQYLPAAFKVSFLIEAPGHGKFIDNILQQIRRYRWAIHNDVTFHPGNAQVHIVIDAQNDQEALHIWQQLEQVAGVQRVTIDTLTTLPLVSKRLNTYHEQLHTHSLQAMPEFIWQFPQSLQTTPTTPIKRERFLNNPFDISRPATTQMFFGRSNELRMMQSDLCDGPRGKALLLYGPRRSGKSSLCKNFLERHVHAPFWHAFASLQNTTQQDEACILAYIAGEIQRALHEQLQAHTHSWNEYNEVDPQVRFKHFILDCFTQAPDTRLILTLDEFGGALSAYENHILDKRFFTYWRDLMSEIEQLSLILVLPSSSHKLLMTTELVLAFTFAESVPLNFLDQKSAEQLLIDPLKEREITIHPNTVARATQLTGRNPYYLSLLGLQFFRQLNDDPKQQLITDTNLDMAIQHIIEAGSEQNFSFYRQELQNRDELRILEGFVELTDQTPWQSLSLKKIATWLKKPLSEVSPHLERLRTGLLLDEHLRTSSGQKKYRRQTSLYYSFKIDLVRLWMSRNRWFFTS